MSRLRGLSNLAAGRNTAAPSIGHDVRQATRIERRPNLRIVVEVDINIARHALGCGLSHNPLGVLVGGLVLGIIESLTVAYVGATFGDVASFGVLVLVLIVRPSGILGKTA